MTELNAAALADCPFCGGPGLNIAGLYVTCGAPQNECPMRGVRCDIAAWNTRTPSDLRAANYDRQQEWDPTDEITLAYRGNELAGEVGEACNVIKKLERERLGIRGSRDTTEHLAEELADIVICTDLIAMQAGINLDNAVRDKFNATSEKYGLKTRLPLQLHDRAAGVGK